MGNSEQWRWFLQGAQRRFKTVNRWCWMEALQDNTVGAPPDSSPAQEWDVRSLGGGLFQLVNHVSGRPVSLHDRELSFRLRPRCSSPALEGEPAFTG